MFVLPIVFKHLVKIKVAFDARGNFDNQPASLRPMRPMRKRSYVLFISEDDYI